MTLKFAAVADTHAIESCTILVRLFQPIAPESFKTIHDEIRQIAKSADLPAVQSIGMPHFMFGPGPNVPMPGPVLNWVYQKYAPDGTVLAEMRCDQQSIALIVREYARWADLLSLVERTLLPSIDLYFQVSPFLTSVQLQYDDKFLADGPENTDELFRDDTEWVNVSKKNTSDPWHSHFGIFLPKEEKENRELINVNVNIFDQLFPQEQVEKRAATISILVGDQYDVPGQEPLPLMGRTAGADHVHRTLIHLHERHRSILNNVLKDDYLRAIGALD